MKSIIAILILCSNLLSQIEIGIEGGMSISDIKLSSRVIEIHENNSSIKSPLVGGFAELNIKGASLQLGVRYVKKGVKGENAILKTTLNLNYIEIPLLIKLKPLKDSFSPVLSGGIYYAFLTSKQIRQEFKTGEIYDDENSIDYESTDMGLLATVGFELKHSNRIISFMSLSYAHGLNNLHKNVLVDASNKSIYIFAGIKYSL